MRPDTGADMSLDHVRLEQDVVALRDRSPLRRVLTDGRTAVGIRWDRGEKRPAVTIYVDDEATYADRFDLLNSRQRAAFAEHAAEDLRTEVGAALLSLATAAPPPRSAEPEVNPRPVPITPTEPWPDPVVLAEVLEVARAHVQRHAILPPHADTALVLWCGLTHFLEHVHYFGILHVMSPTRESGKTLVLELVHLLSARAWSVVSPSLSPLFRVIEQVSPTLILDEADTLSREHVGTFVAIFNDGVRRGGGVARTGKQSNDSLEAEWFPVYCPKAVGSIGVPFGDATVSRTIRVVMQRATPDELARLKKFRQDHAETRWARDVRRRFARAAADDGPTLAALLERAAADDDAAAAVPMPPGVESRPAQIWEPLLALADVAGGDWPTRARAACAHFVAGLKAAEPADDRVRLLADLRSYFTEHPEKRVASSKELLTYLIEDESRGWAEYRHGKPLSDVGLARLLKPFGLKPTLSRSNTNTPSGRGRVWVRAELEPVWDRLAPPADSEQLGSPEPVPHVPHVPHVLHAPPAVTSGTHGTGGTGAGSTTPIPSLATGGRVRVTLDDGTGVETHANDPGLPLFAGRIVHTEPLEPEPLETGWFA